MTSRLPALLALTLFAGGGGATSSTPDAHSPERVARISINDNRIPAGTKRANLLTLRLVATTGMWYPNGDDAPGAAMQAFAEEGHAPRIPGPLIRVRAGTEVLVSIRNAVAGTNLTVHGLNSRTAETHAEGDTIHIEAGATRTLRFRLDAPGTYYYWGTTSGRTIDERTKEDAQLTGAIIVDPATGPIPKDRVMVIGMWADTSGKHFVLRKRMLVVLNGLSWPRTERLTYTVGDTVHWRLINGSADSHPMHLHGFYYLVDSRGDGADDTTYAKGGRDKVVTDLMKPGVTMSMTWSPDRAGNWLFHCHLPVHFSHRGSLGMPPLEVAHDLHSTMNHATQGMSGLVTGVIVKEAPNHVSSRTSKSGARRPLRLVIRPNATGTDAAPNFEFALDDGRKPNTLITGAHSAPPLVLTRGEPVKITVVNSLSEATAVHWHGIELESYYDGVAGFSGSGGRISPVIAPADSFIALFTPPRAGTFIYHTHIDEERQQPAGLAGPIIVLEPGQAYDPAKDFAVVASTPRDRPLPNGVLPREVWLNGSPIPEPYEVRVGERYRIRFINMTTGVPGLRFELAQDEKLVEWRALAKDGADLPADRQSSRAARQPVSIGETADVEFIPLTPGDHKLTARIADGRVVGMLVVRASVPTAQLQQQGQPAIIDMHLHTSPWAPGAARDSAAVHAAQRAILDSLNRYNVVLAIASGSYQIAQIWAGAAPKRILAGAAFPCEKGRMPNAGPECFADGKVYPDTAWLRSEYRAGRLAALGEIVTQYTGLAPSDPSMEPYWQLAEQLDIPVFIHIGPGPPGAAYPNGICGKEACAPNYRMDLSDPLLLEPVLTKHKRLRVLVMHAGWPNLDNLLGLMYAHPQVYADIGVWSTIMPPDEYQSELLRLVRAGYGKRILYGSDLPEMGKAIGRITDAPYLTADQKKDILHDNAARFLRLGTTEPPLPGR